MFWILREKIEYEMNAISKMIRVVDMNILRHRLYPFVSVEKVVLGR